MHPDVNTLAAEWGITISKPELLAQALVHRSYVREHPEEGQESNERLEFLGDAILGSLVAEYLFLHFPDFSEGQLSKAKGTAVSEPLLHQAAKAAGLGQHILLSRAEEAAGGRDRPSILSDAFEAVVAAIYLDQGQEAARRFVLRFLADQIDAIARHEHEHDFKTLFQETVQAEGRPTPTYRIVSEEGPDHAKLFTAEARVGRRVLGRGTGRSKKEAEQSAAHDALDRLAANKARRS